MKEKNKNEYAGKTIKYLLNGENNLMPTALFIAIIIVNESTIEKKIIIARNLSLEYFEKKTLFSEKSIIDILESLIEEDIIEIISEPSNYEAMFDCKLLI